MSGRSRASWLGKYACQHSNSVQIRRRAGKPINAIFALKPEYFFWPINWKGVTGGLEAAGGA